MHICRCITGKIINKTHAIHMTTSVTRRLHIFYLVLNIRAFFITLLLTQLYERVDITNSGENTCMTTSFYKEWTLGLINPATFH